MTQIKFLFCLSSRLILASYDASRVSHPLDYSLPLTRYTNAQLMCKYYLLMDRTNKDFHVVQGLLQKQRKFLFSVSDFSNWFSLRNLEWRKWWNVLKNRNEKFFALVWHHCHFRWLIFIKLLNDEQRSTFFLRSRVSLSFVEAFLQFREVLHHQSNSKILKCESVYSK